MNDDKKFILAVPRVWYNKRERMYWEYCREHNIETIVISPANVKNKKGLVW